MNRCGESNLLLFPATGHWGYLGVPLAEQAGGLVLGADGISLVVVRNVGINAGPIHCFWG